MTYESRIAEFLVVQDTYMHRSDKREERCQ